MNLNKRIEEEKGIQQLIRYKTLLVKRGESTENIQKRIDTVKRKAEERAIAGAGGPRNLGSIAQGTLQALDKTRGKGGAYPAGAFPRKKKKAKKKEDIIESSKKKPGPKKGTVTPKVPLPTPDEIEAMKAEIRDENLEKRRQEAPDTKYRRSPGRRIYRTPGTTPPPRANSSTEYEGHTLAEKIEFIKTFLENEETYDPTSGLWKIMSKRQKHRRQRIKKRAKKHRRLPRGQDDDAREQLEDFLNKRAAEKAAEREAENDVDEGKKVTPPTPKELKAMHDEYVFKSEHPASGRRTPGKPHPRHGEPFPEEAITAWEEEIVRRKTEKNPKTRTFLLPGRKKGPKRNR